MGSKAPLRLPTVDFSKTQLKPGTHEWDLVKLQVIEALEEYGCFEAVYDKVPTELHKALYSLLEELFDLPLPTKMKNRSTKPFPGYVGQYPQFPLYESMGSGDAINIENAENLSSMLWPEKGNANFCKTISSYSQQVSELDQIVRRMVLESLGVEKYYDEYTEATNYVLRVIKYKGPKTCDTMLGLPTHTDKNIVTILSQNQVNGLEVQSKDGTWIDAKISPNSFIVMIGDCFMAWTNGRIHSPRHRVMMTGAEARYSTGLFSVPKAGYLVKTPEELVDEDHPLLFKPFDYVEFLAFYFTAEGKSCKSALKTYCGV